jgi:nucleotide-binding universal stress UspA family protein
MATFQSIVCPVDFSEHSVQALRLAVGIAGRDQARLTVLTVNDPFLVEAAAAAQYGPEYLGDEATKELRGLFQSLIPHATSWAPAPHIVVHTGKAEVEILECAAVEKADLIVMGTHGLSGYRKMFFGSVTERVLRRAAVPVLIVPLTDRRVVVFSDEGPLFHIPGVLVAVDLGPGSDRLIRAAAEVARGFGTSLIIVHVVAEVRPHGGLHAALKAHELVRLKEARDRLRQLASANRGGIGAETLVAYGYAADEIARVAIERNVGAIMIGLTGEGASGSRPGSVAYRVLTMAPAPVLALPLDYEQLGRTTEEIEAEQPEKTFPHLVASS